MISDGSGLSLATAVLCNIQQLKSTDSFCNGDVYPHPTKITLLKLPKQKSMPTPCAGLPSKPAFCKWAK